MTASLGLSSARSRQLNRLIHSPQLSVKHLFRFSSHAGNVSDDYHNLSPDILVISRHVYIAHSLR